DLLSNNLMSSLVELWEINTYLEDAAFTWNVGMLVKDGIKGYKYYKFLKMHFKSGAEIKAAWNQFLKNADDLRDLKNIRKLKGNLGKLRAFWADITKPLDPYAN